MAVLSQRVLILKSRVNSKEPTLPSPAAGILGDARHNLILIWLPLSSAHVGVAPVYRSRCQLRFPGPHAL